MYTRRTDKAPTRKEIAHNLQTHCNTLQHSATRYKAPTRKEIAHNLQTHSSYLRVYQRTTAPGGRGVGGGSVVGQGGVGGGTHPAPLSALVPCRMLQSGAECCRMLQSVAGCCRVLQGVAGCCRVLQCVAVCCSVPLSAAEWC